MGLIHSFCMTESNKINVLNQKKKTNKQKTKQKNRKTPQKRRNAQVSQKFAFMLKNVISLFFVSKDSETHNFSFQYGRLK